jgi:hypothetical protein
MATRILLVLLVLAATLLHPGLREWATTAVGAAVNAPSVRRSTARVEAVTRLLERESADGHPLPRGDTELRELLQRREGAEIGPDDAWGTPLYIHRHLFRVQIGSAGPDRISGTPDDIVGAPLRTTRR